MSEPTSSPLARHVIWDWNGTLLDDFEWIVAAVNHVLVGLGAEAIDAETYRDTFVRPIRGFYEQLLGREIGPEQWRGVQRGFEAAYRAKAHAAVLAPRAGVALEAVRRAGGTQSLLSMLRHDDLIPAVERHRLHEWMLSIDGFRAGCGDHKATHLRAHLERLEHTDGFSAPAQCVMIGDSLDDAHAAGENGVACVLYDGGSHHRAELEATGLPVAACLVDALRLAGLIDGTEGRHDAESVG